MKKLYLLFGLIPMVLAYSCQTEPVFEEPDTKVPAEAINGTGGTESMQYTIEDLVVNPELVVVNATNATLVGVEGDVVKVEMNEDFTFIAGDLVFFGFEGNQMLKKIEGVGREGNVFILTTVNGEFEQMFESGKLEIAVDINKLAEAEVTRARLDDFEYSNILDLTGEYTLGDLIFEPNTRIDMYVYYTVEFKKWQLLPTQAGLHFGLNVQIEPSLRVLKTLNSTIQFDLVDYIPQFILDLLMEQEFSITLPIMDGIEIGFSISELSMPMTLEVNAAAASFINYSYGGEINTGIDICRQGLKINAEPYFKNTLVKTYPTYDLKYFAAEVNTNAQVIITPSFKFLNHDVGFIEGTLTFGVRTMNNYHHFSSEEDGDPQFQDTGYGTKGVFESRIKVKAMGGVIDETFKDDRVLWDIGEMGFIEFFDLEYGQAGSIEGFLDVTAPLDCTLSYWCDVPTKIIPEKLTISFDCYRDPIFGQDLVLFKTYTQEITTTDKGDGTFSFTMDVPFAGVRPATVKKTYIDNIMIQDDYGYTGTLGSRHTITRE